MKVLQGFYVILITLFSRCSAEAVAESSAEQISKTEDDMSLVMAVFRHGDRYPMSYKVTSRYYKNDPNRDFDPYPDSLGGLTIEGKRNSFVFGQKMQQLYGSSLSKQYSPKEAEFRSSSPIRTTMTAMLVGAGFYSPNISEYRWSDTLNWPTIPVTPVKTASEHLLYFARYLCEKSKNYTKEMEKHDKITKKYDQKMRPFYEIISNVTGVRSTSKEINGLYIEFLAQKSAAIELPEWTQTWPAARPYIDLTTIKGLPSDATPMDYMAQVAFEEYKRQTRNIGQQKLTGGLWLKQWLQHVDDHINNRSTKIAYFYGGHEINVANIITTFNFDGVIPAYVSSVILELRRNKETKEYYVMVYHRNDDDVIGHNIHGCGEMCPLEKFKEIFSPIIPSDVEEACGEIDTNILSVLPFI